MNKMLENVMLQAIRNNPNAMRLIKEIEDSGLTAEEYFYKKAREMGFDPNSIVDQIK